MILKTTKPVVILKVLMFYAFWSYSPSGSFIKIFIITESGSDYECVQSDNKIIHSQIIFKLFAHGFVCLPEPR